jgi:hypothetical protein
MQRSSSHLSCPWVHSTPGSASQNWNLRANFMVRAVVFWNLFVCLVLFVCLRPDHLFVTLKYFWFLTGLGLRVEAPSEKSQRLSLRSLCLHSLGQKFSIFWCFLLTFLSALFLQSNMWTFHSGWRAAAATSVAMHFSWKVQHFHIFSVPGSLFNSQWKSQFHLGESNCLEGATKKELIFFVNWFYLAFSLIL